MKRLITKIKIQNWVTLVALFLMHYSVAQKMNVQGNVIDDEGFPLLGVTVVERGTQNGTITDLDGNYSLNVDEFGILDFSYIGFVNESVPVNAQSTIDVTMRVDIVQMEEVVVVGYSSVQKKDLTGAVSVIGAKDFELQPMIRLESALQGKVAGVNVTQTSGNPGSGLKVRIRGINSFSGGNGPLYVVDGFIGADIQSLNPDDIKSIAILKDASAAAIYGSRGSDGVVVITTKNKGESNSIKVAYQKRMSYLRTRWDLMDNWQYMQTINDKLRAGGASEQNLPFSTKDILEAQLAGGTDWQDVIFQPGSQDLVQLTLTGKKFFLSGAGQWNEGIVDGTQYSRYNLRFNYTDEIFEGVELFFSLSDAFEDRVNSNSGEHINAILAATGWPPNLPVIDPKTGDYTRNPAYGPLAPNPAFSLRESPSRSMRNTLLANSYLKFQLAKGLSYKSQGSIELNGSSTTNFNRVAPNNVADNPDGHSYSNSQGASYTWQTSQQLNYKKTIGLHDFRLFTAYEGQSTRSRNFSGSGSIIPTTDLGDFSFFVSDPALQRNGGSRSNSGLWSLFGILDYTFNDKYLFKFNVRHDESSRLASGYRGATFYGGAFAYRISEEDFMKGFSVVDELKLRLSVGQTGSQGVNFGTTQETVGYNNGYSFDGSSIERGTRVSSPVNRLLTWEITDQINAGYDLSILGARINSTVNVFYKKTTGLHFNRQIPEYSGGGTITVNSGSMENKGIELSITGYVIDKNDLSWEISGNVSVVRNKLLDIAGASNEIPSGLGQGGNPDLLASTHNNFVGRPVGLLWGLIFDGVYSTDQADEASEYGRSPGDPIYRDINDDGVIDNEDLTVIGNPHPDFWWGLNTTFRYKNLSVNMVWNGVHGVDVLNSVKWSTFGGHRDATNAEFVNRWTPENQNTNIPGLTATGVLYRQSSQWIENGSFIKLRNITINYDMPINKLGWFKGISTASVFVTAQNALVFTKYSGYDPESLSNSGDKAGGFDEGGYPIPRDFLAGVKITF